MFFVFDGVDGAGKSTQLRLFAGWLKSSGHQVVTCKDPGSTQLGEQMREMLLSHHETPIEMRSEMLMFMTARAQLVGEIIRPALANGQTVVCDRYVFSTVVYQGHAGNLDSGQIWQVNEIATGGLVADLTFILDLDIETAASRLGDLPDRLESRGTDYFEKVRHGFLHEAGRWPRGVEVVDARGESGEVQTRIRKIAGSYLTS